MSSRGDSSSPKSPPKRKGAPAGNKNRETHGYYSEQQAAPPGPAVPDIDSVIIDLQARLEKVAEYMDTTGADDPGEMLKAFNLYAQGVSRLGRLLRDKQVLGQGGANALFDFIDTALDELKDELGLEL